MVSTSLCRRDSVGDNKYAPKYEQISFKSGFVIDL